LALVLNAPENLGLIVVSENRGHECCTGYGNRPSAEHLEHLGKPRDTPGNRHAPSGTGRGITEMSDAVVKEGIVPELEMQLSALDLVQVYENVQGGLMLASTYLFDLSKQLPIG
jgi:hypothetical protein